MKVILFHLLGNPGEESSAASTKCTPCMLLVILWQELGKKEMIGINLGEEGFYSTEAGSPSCTPCTIPLTSLSNFDLT